MVKPHKEPAAEFGSIWNLDITGFMGFTGALDFTGFLDLTDFLYFTVGGNSIYYFSRLYHPTLATCKKGNASHLDQLAPPQVKIHMHVSIYRL